MNKLSMPFILGATIVATFLGVTLGCGGKGASSSSAVSPSTLTLTPRAASVEARGPVVFSIGATGAAVKGERVLVVEEPGGGIMVGTTYRAPKKPGIYHVRLTSTGDPSLTERAEITVTPQTKPSGEISFSLALLPNEAIVVGSVHSIGIISLKDVHGPIGFTVVEPDGGVVHSAPGESRLSYSYHAPATPGTYHIKATALEDDSIECVREVKVVAH